MISAPRSHRPRRHWLALIAGIVGLLALLALAGCGVPLIGAGPTPTPTPPPDPATLLQQASTADWRDVTFTLAFNGTELGQTVNATGGGKATKNPQRVEVNLTLPFTLAGTTAQITIDEIVDFPTSTAYSRIGGIPGVPNPGQWTKSPISAASSTGSPIDPTTITDFTKTQNAKLIGAETLNGVAVWHIQGTETDAASGTSATTDIYIRQDNHYPLKVTVHSTTTSTPGTTAGAGTSDITILFTQYNSGVTITLPTVS
jgi:hypothetical protein